MRLRALSMRSRLLAGILLPVLVIVAVNTVSLYRQALAAANEAYDRTLLTSAKAIGEVLEVTGDVGDIRVAAPLPYAALEPFETDQRSRVFYRVAGFDGETVSGHATLSPWRGKLPVQGPYAALVDFYDDVHDGERVRVAVLLQPVAGQAGVGMATVQVAETLEVREAMARRLLMDTLWRQAALVAVIALVVVAVVQAATRPVRELSARLASRAPTDLAPVGATDAPRELQPLVTATNALIGQLAQVLSNQKRFVRDTSHQLRTPLAVLRAQLQSAQRGDLPPQQALAEMATTVDRATELANQMLALAKVEQLKRQDDAGTADWSAIARSVALDLAPLIADKALDFTVDTEPAPLRAHEWALRELTRNLLHNAVKHSPQGAPLLLQLSARADLARMRVADAGPGIDAAQRERLFQPFAHRHQSTTSGAGLGLAICHEIVLSLGGRIALDNRTPTSQSPGGLDAVVELPLAAPARAAGAGASQNV